MPSQLHQSSLQSQASDSRLVAAQRRFLAFAGAREREALGVRWADVDFEGKLVTIGAAGDSKNREARHVDLNAQLESHLREMFKRRAPARPHQTRSQSSA